jgi:glutamyl-tRNA synthetase
VNKAGYAKFDWDKLNWLNSQYHLHKILESAELTDLLIPYLQKVGYEFDAQTDRSWLEQWLLWTIGTSLVRLTDAVDMCKLFFSTWWNARRRRS